MSRIGKLPVDIPAGVTITVGDKEITVAGPKGTLTVPVQENTTTKASPRASRRNSKSMVLVSA